MCCSKNIEGSTSRWTGLSVLFGRNGAPWLFGEGTVEPPAQTTLAVRRIGRGGYGGTARNRVVLGVPCSGRSHATSTRMLPPYPLRRHCLLGTCGYRSSPSSKTAHRKSSLRDPTRSGFSSSFPIRRGRRSRKAKPHHTVLPPLRSDAVSWRPSRALGEESEVSCSRADGVKLPLRSRVGIDPSGIAWRTSGPCAQTALPPFARPFGRDAVALAPRKGPA